MAVRLARNTDDAGDLVQETVLRAYRFFSGFTPGTNCRAWLMTILFNNFRNGYRRAGREQVSQTEEEFVNRVETQSFQSDPQESDPAWLANTNALEPEVEKALVALPDEFRTAMILVDVQELSYQEVSAALH